MPNIKMKKGNYKDSNSIYDVMNYCLNHDLRDYDVIYLPNRNDCMKLAIRDRANEVKYMADFLNVFLDVYNRNSGKRLNYFIIGLGYENQVKVHYYGNVIPYALLQFMETRGFPSLIAYHVTPEGYHHIHLLIGITNIYGQSAYSNNINAWTIAKYLNSDIPGLQMQVVADD